MDKQREYGNLSPINDLRNPLTELIILRQTLLMKYYYLIK